MNKHHLDRLQFWIAERERIRILKEAGAPKPWTQDPILQSYRFCNVHREDDAVTRWIREKWREPFMGHDNMVPAMALARLVNWPPCLDFIGFPEIWDEEEYVSMMQSLKDEGHRLWSGAYMVTAGGKKEPKHVAVCRMVTQFCVMRTDFLSCYDAWQEFQYVPGMGSFLAAQMVADLKHTHVLKEMDDVYTFCAPGPGSMKGMNLLHDLPENTDWSQEEFENAVNHLRTFSPEFVDAQDMQNCLCEFFKYSRGTSRSKYPGRM